MPKVSWEDQQQIGGTASLAISKENIYAMIAENEVRYQSGSAAWKVLTEGTEKAVMGQ